MHLSRRRYKASTLLACKATRVVVKNYFVGLFSNVCASRTNFSKPLNAKDRDAI